MGGRIRPQDIFVLNTRFTGSGQFPAMTPAVAASLAANLRATFPCNRIIALNGMSFDPTVPGYAFSGIDDPNVFALLTDYEQVDWNCGTGHRSRPAALARQVPEGASRGSGAGTSASCPPWRRTRSGAGKRTGLAPQDNGTWNFGQIAQNLNKQNARLGDPQDRADERSDAGRLRRRRRRRLRRARQAAAAPLHVQVHHQEGSR